MDEIEEIGAQEGKVERTIPTQILAWSMYDLANTIFSMGIVSLIAADFFQIMGAVNQGMSTTAALSLFSVTVSIAYLIVAVLLPLVGGYADRLPSRVHLLSAMTLVTISATAALSFIQNFYIGLTTFLVALIAYQLSLVVYDSMLPWIAAKKDIAKVAGIGVAFGYFGSFIAIGLSFYLMGQGYAAIDVDTLEFGYSRPLFIGVAVSFFILALPILAVQERSTIAIKPKFTEVAKESMEDVVHTFKLVISKHRDMKIFIIGWLLFVEAANTVVLFMGSILRDALLLDEEKALVILAIGIASAVLFTYPVGYITERIGPKKGFILVTLLWIASLIAGMLTNITIAGTKMPEFFAYFMAILVGPSLGGTWVVNRQYVIELAPKSDVGKYFGITNIAGRVSAVIGPPLWSVSVAVAEWAFGWKGKRYLSYRFALVMVILLMLLGTFIITRVTDYHQQYLNGTRPWDLHPEEYVITKQEKSN